MERYQALGVKKEVVFGTAAEKIAFVKVEGGIENRALRCAQSTLQGGSCLAGQRDFAKDTRVGPQTNRLDAAKKTGAAVWGDGLSLGV
jgi:hypothetical protein